MPMSFRHQNNPFALPKDDDGLGGSPGPLDGGAPKRSNKRARTEADTSKPSDEEVREELVTFPDLVTDPLDFERVKLLMSWLTTSEVAKMKVEI